MPITGAACVPDDLAANHHRVDGVAVHAAIVTGADPCQMIWRQTITAWTA
ncbi:hypothetical protein RCH14_003739 [Massilia sp. MP_M2]